MHCTNYLSRQCILYIYIYIYSVHSFLWFTSVNHVCTVQTIYQDNVYIYIYIKAGGWSGSTKTMAMLRFMAHGSKTPIITIVLAGALCMLTFCLLVTRVNLSSYLWAVQQKPVNAPQAGLLLWSIMHSCTTTSTYSPRASPSCCMYLL